MRRIGIIGGIQMLGIIGAMEVEVEKLKARMENVEITRRASMEFYAGTLEGKNVVVVRSGIGKVNAAVCTQILIDEFEAEAVINTGIAGSLNADINIEDLVISTDLVHHDMNAVAFGYPVGQIPQMEAFSFRSDETLRKLAVQACRDVNPDIEVYEGRIASGDQFVADQGVKDEIIKNFDACAVEMEGAAIAQAAYLNNVPFLVVRAISDKADGSAEVDYPTFEALAVEHCVKMTLRILNQIKD